MKDRIYTGAAIALLCVWAGVTGWGHVWAHHPFANLSLKGTVMSQHASGPFEVKLMPQQEPDATLARMILDKQFHGGLEAAGKGEMLSAGTAVKGSAGYVAIEKVSGTLNGRKGTFILQHNATMTRGAPQLSITVVPDSGTGELAGITGSMTIDIAPDGKHSYDFDYALAAGK